MYHARVMLLCALLLVAQSFFGPVFQSAFFIQNRIAAPEGVKGVSLADTTPHSSINISSNQDFILQGWPGNGTEESPYVIEALSIDFDGCCLNISNTNVFFAVSGCLLQTNSEAGRYSVHFQNVTNGRIENSSIESYASGIFLENCEDCSIEECVFDTGWWCVRLESCLTCTILSSILFSSVDGIWAYDCPSLEVALNNISGINGDDGIIVGMCPNFMIRNNSVQSFSDEGIFIYSSHGGAIVNNTVQCTIGPQGSCGLSLYNVTNSRIVNNNVSTYRYGSIFNGHDCLFESNIIHNNDQGLLTWSTNCNYSRNMFGANYLP
ncbi:MAG: right-handed parallel beta-helix repeat-containing protein [Candidatus Thorarchaeota archaeon]|nr:right-handed parallel beta-helix repeat-containing protein [Candidatus Thorarchaeota archaeon]